MIIKKITQHFLKPTKNSIGTFVVCVIAIVGSSTPVYGQEWTFDPIVRLGAEVDDNANLSIRTDQEAEISGFTADLTARVDYLSSVTSFYVAPRVRWRRFDESEFDSTDIFVRMNYRYRTQASTFALRVFAEREAVRTAERADTDLDVDDPLDITNDDSGFVQLGGDRDKYRIRPSWRYQFSNTFALTSREYPSQPASSETDSLRK